jgi:hypothetical protein
MQTIIKALRVISPINIFGSYSTCFIRGCIHTRTYAGVDGGQLSRPIKNSCHLRRICAHRRILLKSVYRVLVSLNSLSIHHWAFCTTTLTRDTQGVQQGFRANCERVDAGSGCENTTQLHSMCMSGQRCIIVMHERRGMSVHRLETSCPPEARPVVSTRYDVATTVTVWGLRAGV